MRRSTRAGDHSLANAKNKSTSWASRGLAERWCRVSLDGVGSIAAAIARATSLADRSATGGDCAGEADGKDSAGTASSTGRDTALAMGLLTGAAGVLAA